MLGALWIPSSWSILFCITFLQTANSTLSPPRPPPTQHLFASEHRDDIIRCAIEHAGNYIGITLRLRKDPLTFEVFTAERLGKYSSDDSITSLAEFVVQKISPRHQVSTPRSRRDHRHRHATEGPTQHHTAKHVPCMKGRNTIKHKKTHTPQR